MCYATNKSCILYYNVITLLHANNYANKLFLINDDSKIDHNESCYDMTYLEK